jgi:hypothetical protein
MPGYDEPFLLLPSADEHPEHGGIADLFVHSRWWHKQCGVCPHSQHPKVDIQLF